MANNLAEQFGALWQSNDPPPDVFAFLEQSNGSDSTDVLAVLLTDQQHRWKTDTPLKVEDYLCQLPYLASDPDCKLQLAVGEFQARRNGDTSPGIDEFTSRFSDIGDELRGKLSELAAGDNGDEQRGFTTTETQFFQTTIDAQKIGRYRLVRILGEGAFGRVYLAFDEELQRQVAIKVPTIERLRKTEATKLYLEEARKVAGLDHPNIVPVYDTGRADDGSVYVVSKFIEGGDLAERIKHNRPSLEEAAKLIATAAQALHHAHEKRLVHRDIKPANILIEEETGQPYVADFGLAIREEDYLKEGRMVGTPAYMSPEQARGEGHRLDGRSDLFSLGVVLYELLTGKKPFRGGTQNEVLHNIISTEPTPPREHNAEVPNELQRICLKALSKRVSARHHTGLDFSDDLLHWLAGPEEASVKEVKIVPKGLRSFDADDADFFLNLLPGPRNRDGLPESIQFWKTRIEETDSDKTFSVGLIYGPSGCGKSSLMKAGLLPQLSQNVVAVYLEATPDETEIRILGGLRKQLPELPSDLGLVETLTRLRRGEGRKVVIILDQFEQWLHAHRAEQETELVSALRQCNNGTLQAIVMVRDDFAMAASRFMRELETRIIEGHNFATVDLFDVDHARNVLIKFGQAFGKLPAPTAGLSDEEREFVRTVASGLAQDAKVVSVRLALFAEMVKSKPWTPATLDEVGGTEGIGVNFLEETFSSRGANPEHRLHQQAAREVLKALLPEVGSDIKGNMRSHADLQKASGYQNRPSDFNGLLRILDGELRLITPTDPEGFQTDSGSDLGSKYYQLTHDYLVPSLHEWLTRKQKETRKGRAELKLEERAALWNAKPENRHLPSLLECRGIRTLTDKRRWTPPQRQLMQRARRFHGVRNTVLLLLLAVMTFTGLRVRDRVVETNNEERAAGFVRALVNADIDQVPAIVSALQDYRQWADPKLRDERGSHGDASNERLNISLALLPTDATQLDYLKHRLLNAEPEQVATIRLLLESHQGELVSDLWRVAESPGKGEEGQLLQAASALAVYDTDNEEKWTGIAYRVVKVLVNENPLRVAVWIKTLQPARRHLLKPLSVFYRSKGDDCSQMQISMATEVLEQHAADDLTSLAELLLDAEPKQFVALFDEFKAHGDDALSKLNEELDRTLAFHWNDPPLDPSWSEPTAKVTGKIKQAQGMIAERFAFCQTMPLAEFTQVAEELRKSGYRPIRLRPFAHNNSVHVAAAWTRDDRDWRMATGQSAVAIQQQAEEQQEEGFAAVDIAGYVGESDGSPAELYSILWMKKRDYTEDTRFFIGATNAEYNAEYQAFTKERYLFQHSLQVYRSLDGQARYSGVKTKASEISRLSRQQPVAAFESKEYFDMIHWDIDLSNAPDTPTTVGNLALRYTAVWNASAEFESLESHGLSPAEHLVKCDEMQTNGYRLASISSASINGEPVTASVWHRPLIPDEKKETLARRQANAAVAALRLGETDKVWPLLKHSPDPRLRTWIIHRLNPLGASPESIVKRLSEEPGISIRRALILILGEYGETSQLDREALSVNLLELYRNDPDPGIHGAAEWVLRRWGKGEDIAKIDTELATGKVAGERNWYLTKQGHTMVVIPGPVEFLMGSPATEKGRGSLEPLRRKRIGRSFAIASKEVTVKQFQEFLRNTPSVRHYYTKKYAPKENCPQTAVTWYEAAAYCRWLSEQEGIAEDQMCYPPTAEIKQGMKLPSDYLSRTGYRLPSEAEWEYACRSNAVTSRYYGVADELLGQYAWFIKTSNNRAWPVGSLKPNDRGLFDMQGNVWEWCQERSVSYSGSLGSVSEDREDNVSLKDSTSRVLRGGSFNYLTSYVRSALRYLYRPSDRSLYSGFRPSRTYNLSP